MFDKEKLPSNKYLNMALGGSFAVQFLALLIPGLRNLLGITPISLLDGVVIGGSAVLPLLVNELTKRPPRGDLLDNPVPRPQGVIALNPRSTLID